MIAHQGCSRLIVVCIRVARADARAAFDDHFMAAFHQLISGGRKQCDAIFLAFDFFGNAHNHNGLMD